MNRTSLLIKQFIDAKGIKHADLNSKEFLEDFRNFLLDMKSISYDYIYLIKSLGLDPDTIDTAEIWKSSKDTIVEPYKTSIITTDDSKNYSILDSRRIIEGELTVFDNRAFIKTKDKLYQAPGHIDTFMTHNPTSIDNIHDLPALHNNDYNIIIGAFGNISDKDQRKKIREIKRLKYDMDSEIIEEYATAYNSYYYVLASGLKKAKENISVLNYIKGSFNPISAYARKK